MSKNLSSFFSGLAAGVTESIFVLVPMETIKVQLIHDRLKSA